MPSAVTTKADTGTLAASAIGGTWTIGSVSTAPPATESLFSIDPKIGVVDGTQNTESVFAPDLRTLVDSQDFQDGGKYRSIVKLVMKYEGQKSDDIRWAMGSGWLISEDTFVTAGHCVFDRAGDGRGFGKVKTMKVYIGYNGQASVSDPSVQERTAVKIVTTAGWLRTGNRSNDVAFIKVDQPFTGNLRVYKYVTTAEKPVTEMIGVVGYPGDQKITIDGTTEKGAQMWEMFAPVQYDLNAKDNQVWHMLRYEISTYAGQSGSPVLLKGSQTSVATHCYGGTREEGGNSASVIGGRWGNAYDTFVAALTKPNSQIDDITGKTLPINPSKGGNETGGLGDTEDFFSVLKDIGRVVSPIAQTGLSIVSPLLGPLGGPISAIGSVALGALGKVCSESAMGDGGPPPSNIPPKATLADGAVQRAVVAEATLQTVLRMERGPTNQKIVDKMAEVYSDMAFNPDRLAPHLVPLMSQAGLRLAVDSDLVSKAKAPPAVTGTKQVPGSSEAILPGSPGEDFMAGLAETQVKVRDGAEGFFDTIGNYVSAGMNLAAPFLLTGAQAGLHKLVDYLDSKQKSSTESAFESDPDDDTRAAALLAKRAAMAECALQAVMSCDKDELKNARLLGDAGSGVQPEGFFDSLLGTVQSIGGAVLKAAPSVLQTALPLVLNAVAKGAGGGAAGAAPTPVRSSRVVKSANGLNGSVIAPDSTATPNPPDVMGNRDGVWV